MRRNASIIGPTITPTTAAASGIWSLDDVRRHKAAGIWPAANKATYTYLTPITSTSDLSTYTFNATAIGTARTDRLVIVGFAYEHGSGATVTSVVIGGVTATLLVSHSGANIVQAMYAALVPTGTTANIVITLSAAAVRLYGVVGNLIGYSSATPNDTLAGSGSPSSGDIDVLSLGVVIGFAAGFAASSVSWTWTNLTEDYDNFVTESPNNGVFTGAHQDFATAQTVTVTATKGGTNSNDRMIAVAYH